MNDNSDLRCRLMRRVQSQMTNARETRWSRQEVDAGYMLVSG